MTIRSGRLIRRDGTCTNATCSSDSTLATRAAEEQRPLNSSYADAVFENLDRFTIGFTAPDGYTTRVTFKVHGFMLVRSVQSVHGTFVKLRVLDGTITLDDASIHLSEDLATYLESQGLVTSDQDASAFGTRLQTGLASVLGIFGYFDEATYPDLPDDQEPPRSPSLPYVAIMVDTV
eukprot:5068818-Amphidinium_carterae.1